MNKIAQLGEPLKNTDASGTMQGSVPSSDMVNKLVAEYDKFRMKLPEMLGFLKAKLVKYPVFATFPLKQSDIDKMNTDMQTLQSLPYPA